MTILLTKAEIRNTLVELENKLGDDDRITESQWDNICHFTIAHAQARKILAWIESHPLVHPLTTVEGYGYYQIDDIEQLRKELGK